jgi:hypothetical protein
VTVAEQRLGVGNSGKPIAVIVAANREKPVAGLNVSGIVSVWQSAAQLILGVLPRATRARAIKRRIREKFIAAHVPAVRRGSPRPLAVPFRGSVVPRAGRLCDA